MHWARKERWVALYIGESFDWIELKDSEGNIKCPRIRIREKSSKADILMGVCYRPSNQDEEMNGIFYKQLGAVSKSLALILVGGFSLPYICWKCNTAERKQLRGFLECVEENFVTAGE